MGRERAGEDERQHGAEHEGAGSDPERDLGRLGDRVLDDGADAIAIFRSEAFRDSTMDATCRPCWRSFT